MKKSLTVALTLIVCAVLFFTRPKAPQYQLAAVQVRDLSETIEAVGTVVPQQTCALMPSAAGKVKRIFVQEGQTVGAGQAVAELELLPEDAAAYLSALQNAEWSQSDVQERMHALCTVTAPQAGEIIGLEIYVGQQTAPGGMLGYVTSEELAVTSYVPENLREDLFEGQCARIKRGGNELEGVICRITPAAEAVGQYLVRIEPVESTRLLAPGMKVDVVIPVDACTAPAVPLQALQPDGTVLCRTEQGAVAVPVKTGLCTENYAQLISGPPVGTHVILGEVQ